MCLCASVRASVCQTRVCVCARVCARASACAFDLKKKILARPLPALKLVREQPHVFNLAERHAQIGAVRGVARLINVCTINTPVSVRVRALVLCIACVPGECAYCVSMYMRAHMRILTRYMYKYMHG